MTVNFIGLKKINPFQRPDPWNHHSDYLIVSIMINILWGLRIISPAAWWGALFSYTPDEIRYFPRSRPMELYLLLVLTLGFLFLFLASVTQPVIRYAIIVAACLFIVEIIQYHVYLMIIRPIVDKNYIQYNPTRTIILTFIAYINIINYFACLYLYLIPQTLSNTLSPWSAWTFSVGEITGSGYGALDPTDSIWLALLSGTEKIVGVLFLAIIISLSLTRMGFRHFDQDPSRSSSISKKQADSGLDNDSRTE